MKSGLSRREFAGLFSLGAIWPFARGQGAVEAHTDFRIRTITAGLHLQSASQLEQAKSALAFLHRARESFEADGYQVQTIRLATQPLGEYLPQWTEPATLKGLKVLDQFARDNDIVCSIGPVITDDRYHPEFGSWAAELVQQTSNISFSCQVASVDAGVHIHALRSAADAIHAITRATPTGEGNFRFAATAFIPPGTPFFPAAYFDQGNSFTIGLESPALLTEVFRENREFDEVRQRLGERMEAALSPVARRAQALADSAGWRYLGIDTSPAPGLDASIGQAIETLTNAPFGSPSTLAACAAITDVLKGLRIRSCGYCGLMLPVLEDPVLAQRAAEGRYGITELLLYSSVCGTGLDVVPLPGDTSVYELAAIIADVAALATKYRKPLSARLFPIPGKRAGERVSFENPHLTQSIVMPL